MLFSFGILRFAGDLTTARRASVNPLEEKRDLGVHGLSEMESVAASPGAFLTVHGVEAIVEVYSVARSVSLHNSAYGAFGSVSSSLPTWSVAGLCCFPTACFHTVKLKNLSRLAVVGIPGVGSVVWADAELGHLFRLMQLQPPAKGAL
ncbi:hypothetical protein F2Q69_00040408 [Brassica cretica]|uniref:Uncharacterized protein n=1 Tax=Brassica cretica TaxID=69181 RepID=A0A8S9NJX0_BRACR|nr:hypothetical protein F2Q69_00040408 [Brassica cretica]